MAKNKTLSLKVSPEIADYINEQAKAQGNTKSEYIRNAVNAMKTNKVELSTNNIELNNEDLNVLRTMGIASASGYLGFKLAKLIRTKYTESDNEASDMLIGVALGLGGLFVDIYAQQRNSK